MSPSPPQSDVFITTVSVLLKLLTSACFNNCRSCKAVVAILKCVCGGGVGVGGAAGGCSAFWINFLLSGDKRGNVVLEKAQEPR